MVVPAVLAISSQQATLSKLTQDDINKLMCSTTTNKQNPPFR